MRHGAKNVCQCAENVLHGAKNVGHGAKMCVMVPKMCTLVPQSPNPPIPQSPNPLIPHLMEYCKSLGAGQDCRQTHIQTDGQTNQYYELTRPQGQVN